MRVLVTGGTGFVGCHSVRALIDAGHSVRLLVRAPERMAPALEPLGVRDVDFAVGDITEREAVRRALDGCEAVLHAASVYALSGARASEMERVNPAGTEVVLGTAHRMRLDPIVHVSSYAALLPAAPDRILTADSPVGRPAGPYGRSKAASETIARNLQQQGAPVVITQPGVVWGPHDPHLGETARIALTILRNRMPVLPGAMPIIDVRDVAAANAALMQPGRGARRFLLVAEDVTFSQLIDVFRRLTGRRLPAVPLPRALVSRTLGRLARVPADLEGPWFALQSPRTDAAPTESELGVRFRAAEESIAATIGWLHADGHVDDRRVGRALAAGHRMERDEGPPSAVAPASEMAAQLVGTPHTWPHSQPVRADPPG